MATLKHVVQVYLLVYLTFAPVVQAALPTEHFDERPVSMPAAIEASQLWREIVAGEAGGGWPEGTLLVAWTMRAWEINLGFRADQFGPAIGWYGRSTNIDKYAWRAVDSAFGADLSGAPFSWMREGRWCRYLGSQQDREYWLSTGFVNREPDVVLAHPNPAYSRFTLNCWWSQ